ncbi:unnamed protein product [Ambrosiozyma monospora]|uniref:Unnamed protein product n=1 Tax=Ambrosiozyma monospora TaxID=43982 RepID=A0A9W6Z4V0_AMBMO|nr:unnamed protein product [Ambrosiozyma monospora]
MFMPYTRDQIPTQKIMKVISLSSCSTSSSTISPCLKFNVQELSKYDHDQSTPESRLANNCKKLGNLHEVRTSPPIAII